MQVTIEMFEERGISHVLDNMTVGALATEARTDCFIITV